MVNIEQCSQLPGYEIVKKGLLDLRNNKASQESYLVKIASYNLTAAGLMEAPINEEDLDLALYRHLSERVKDPHYQYQALTDRLVKFEQALFRLTN